MSGSAATQPSSGAATQGLAPALNPPADLSSSTLQNNDTMTEVPTKQSSLVKIPSRTSSNTKPTDPTTSNSTPVPAVPDEPPSTPRRGSKRSLLSRSRNNSRSSRKSARATRAVDPSKTAAPPISQPESSRPEKKSRGGFLAFLNCCSPSDDLVQTKSDEPDVAAKKINIQTTTQRSAGRPQDPTSIPETEKTLQGEASLDEKTTTLGDEDQPELSEKNRLDDGRPRISREDAQRDRVAPVTSTTNPTLAATASKPIDQASSSDQHDQSKSTSAAVPNVKIVGAAAAQSNNSDQSESHDDGRRRNSDVEMPDAPPDTSTIDDEPLDEPAQPAELQPRVALPPPPPLAQRQEQVGTNEAPPVPEPPPEKTTWLLPPIQPRFKGRKCLVLDLDETLVHSSFKILNQADFTIPVEIEGQYHNVYVIKRPGVDAFMKRVGELYEVVVFTASVSKYGDPLLDQLDIHHVVHHRLFRESCYNHQGNYVKDLSQVGRDLKETIIIDNSPTSYIFHPQHAVPISSWFSDAHDNELLDLIPVLEDLAGPKVQDVSLVLDVAL
ncbi:hypothetical protein PV10_00842 [Exophiala mesophila]|uniref:FCP1 homology domain-containing protein n=1 Tax=Exophiala mesophila TaxID=212818 RepID=A0A0D1X5L5_EXOME|nr:uncharacterized protein PV10_00842 [Exophiala mesophila]KIV97040.1 hypothetical protein PV10_00842 [Exophiala mesophila]